MSRIAFLSLLLIVPQAFAQELPLVRGVEGQPLMAQVIRLKEALAPVIAEIEIDSSIRREGHGSV